MNTNVGITKHNDRTECKSITKHSGRIECNGKTKCKDITKHNDRTECKDRTKEITQTITQLCLCLNCPLLCRLIVFKKDFCFLEKRKKVRLGLVEEIANKKSLSQEQKIHLLTPGTPVPFADVSLSHSVSMGGFVIGSLAYPPLFSVGFDLEQAGRAKVKTVLRISKQEELSQAPSPSFLWSAKEAVYKNICNLQYLPSSPKREQRGRAPVLIKHISLFNWELFKDSPLSERGLGEEPLSGKSLGKSLLEEPMVYRFQFQYKDHKAITPIKGEGFVFSFAKLIVAFSKTHL